MTEQLPIFPLGMVAFPGMTVPLHIFEERYRAMVRHLLTIDDPARRRFGIVAIREGYETGGHEARSMYRIGCVVQLGTVSQYDDGRFDLAAVGQERMRVMGTDASGPFLVADVEVMPEETRPSVDTAREAAHALATFADYRDLVSELRGDDVMTGSLPRDPELLSYVLASTCSLTLRERQQLLESPTTHERLGLLRRLMRREIGAMNAIPSLPATEVARSGWSPN
ncbi:LON peptidase substrate-binding domain-containing protein [Nocardioides sp. HDW12B]|uniref:LON peptidase substrate-binding domain-containing protein n=1 Tax=Nocardioides sp. HDW12B TaxID=2714939 RepID=UPI0014086879|nr:LON peptidase substrate-binding domain-containing protein [Nocardioides sp. HDW12B]QIK66873.1 LON peptidase substrate-binding domain-containing protein [Nocardioides sp. HDW12B]